jgi:hypothetical protein
MPPRRLVASVVASRRPTLRPDPLLANALPAPPTTLREFPSTDTLAIYAEAYDNDTSAHEIETTVIVTSERGELKSRTVLTVPRGNGVVPIKKTIPLVSFTPGYYTLAVEARQTANRAISAGRALPFQIVDAGNR